jgi:hypothetical protein
MGWVWGALLGASVGLQDRANNEMVAQGIRPSWSQRHAILSSVLWMLALLVGVVVWINLAVAWPHPVLIVTGVLAVVGVVWICVAAYARAERRWGNPYQGTRLVSQRAIEAPRQRVVVGVLTLLGIYTLAGGLLAALFWLL